MKDKNCIIGEILFFSFYNIVILKFIYMYNFIMKYTNIYFNRNINLCVYRIIW